MGNSLDLDILTFLEWADDDEQDPEILLAAFLAFPGLSNGYRIWNSQAKNEGEVPPRKTGCRSESAKKAEKSRDGLECCESP